MATDLSNTEYFNQTCRAHAEARRQVDFDDSQRELAGVEVGRIGRFLSAEAREAAKEARSGGGKGCDSATMTALEMALMDPDYAEAFHAAEKEIREAQKIVDDLQDDIAATIEKMDSRIEEMLDAAATLPDGRKAFMDENGDVWTVDAERVDQAIVDGIDFDGRPKLGAYEAMLTGRERLDKLDGSTREAGLQLGEYSNALNNDDDPQTMEGIQHIREGRDAVVDHAHELRQSLETIDRSLEQDINGLSAAPKADGQNMDQSASTAIAVPGLGD